MEKKIQLVIDLIENSIRFQLNQIQFTFDGRYLEISSKDTDTFNATELVGTLSSIDNIGCYLDYNKKIEKVVLVIY